MIYAYMCIQMNCAVIVMREEGKRGDISPCPRHSPHWCLLVHTILSHTRNQCRVCVREKVTAIKAAFR